MSENQLEGPYVPSTDPMTREQVELYERTDGHAGATMQGGAVIVLTMRGARSGKLRKVALMRIERNGVYAVGASGGTVERVPGRVWKLGTVRVGGRDVRLATDRQEPTQCEAHDRGSSERRPQPRPMPEWPHWPRRRLWRQVRRAWYWTDRRGREPRHRRRPGLQDDSRLADVAQPLRGVALQAAREQRP